MPAATREEEDKRRRLHGEARGKVQVFAVQIICTIEKLCRGIEIASLRQFGMRVLNYQAILRGN